jgi:hypothetical protein
VSGFTDPIVGGQGTLIRQQIQSPNFSIAAQTGWAILKNGSAYFFNVTATGTITSTEVVVQGATGGIFIYSGIPATGNLIGSWAGNAGTDAFGNIYPQGEYNANGTSNITFTPDSGLVKQFFTTGNPNITTPSALYGIYNSGSAVDELEITSAKTTGFLDQAGLLCTSSNSSGTSPATAALYYNYSTGLFIAVEVNYRGTQVNGASAVVGLQPGTGTSRTNLAQNEIWHTPALSVDWNNVAGNQSLRYQFEPINGGRVRLDGSVQSSGALGANAPYLNAPLPSAYWPATQKRFSGMVNSVSGGGFGKTIVMVDTAGNITCPVAASGANQQVCFDGLTYPLD